MFNVPTWEYQYRWMALERPGQLLRSLYAEIDAPSLNGRDSRLRNARSRRETVLAHALKFPDDPYRFAGRYLHSSLGPMIFAHTISFGNHEQ